MRGTLIEQEFADELAELHDGSVSLFVTLPVFRRLMESSQRADALQRVEAGIGEHLAYLDGILGEVDVARDRVDSELTRWLFEALVSLSARVSSAARDRDILAVIQQAQVFLVGSCSFALRCARQVRREHSVQVLEASLGRIGSLAPQLSFAPAVSMARGEWSHAVA